MASGKVLLYLFAVSAYLTFVMSEHGFDPNRSESGPPDASPGRGPPGPPPGRGPPGPPPGQREPFDSDVDDVETEIPYSSESSGDDSDEPSEGGSQDRFFFSSLFNTRFVTCDYSTQAGTRCSGCRTVLTCFRSNVGKQRTCRGFFPYCNNGRCSLFRGPACDPTTTAAAATTAAATTTVAATTTTTAPETTTG